MQNRPTHKNFLPTTTEKLEQILKKDFGGSKDLVFDTYKKNDKKIAVFYVAYLIQTEHFEKFMLEPLLNDLPTWTKEEIQNNLPLSGSDTVNTLDKALKFMIDGIVCLYIEGEKEIILYPLLNKEKRSLAMAETESLVLGPKISFTESMETNLNIVRFRIRSTDLAIEEFEIGSMSPSIVRMCYMKSVANGADVNTMRQRLQDLDVDEIYDSVVLKQYIEDSQWSIFPQFDSTELPDRFTYNITKGKIGVLVENSPTAIIGPSTLFSFFESTEDLYMRWNAGTALRILRFIAIIISIFLTPFYVAAVTFQYSIIPGEELVTLGQSRAAVPFPPLIEAILFEFMIEVLREAGARLPTKIGQTMGIVGGIVIGEAAVQAGWTSNILIIVGSISALASFTSPSYLMSVTIRLIRFPLIILSGLLGMLGIMFGVVFLIIHLLKITSLGRPYLVPLYPLQLKDFNKVFFRSPFPFYSRRAKTYRPKKMKRFSKKEAKKKHDNSS